MLFKPFAKYCNFEDVDNQVVTPDVSLRATQPNEALHNERFSVEDAMAIEDFEEFKKYIDFWCPKIKAKYLGRLADHIDNKKDPRVNYIIRSLARKFVG